VAALEIYRSTYDTVALEECSVYSVDLEESTVCLVGNSGRMFGIFGRFRRVYSTYIR
jgi:hypothetical protein